jgi:hypothetical protein
MAQGLQGGQEAGWQWLCLTAFLQIESNGDKSMTVAGPDRLCRLLLTKSVE